MLPKRYVVELVRDRWAWRWHLRHADGCEALFSTYRAAIEWGDYHGVIKP